jgi:hypothetical protein
MTRTDLRVLFEIPDYWTPEQALAVYELLDGLREIILSRYEAQIIDAVPPFQHCLAGPPHGSVLALSLRYSKLAPRPRRSRAAINPRQAVGRRVLRPDNRPAGGHWPTPRER